MKNNLRGFTLIETVIAIAVLVILIGIPVRIILNANRAFSRSVATIGRIQQMDSLASNLEASAHTSDGVYTPSVCMPTDGTVCTAGIRFYGVDSTGAVHFWGWDYDSTTGRLQQCLAYGSSEGPCLTPGKVLTGITTFSATPVSAQTIATNLGLSAVGITTQEHEVYPSDPQILAGNRVMEVSVGNAQAIRAVDLLQPGTPFTTSVVDTSYDAPPIGILSVSTLGVLDSGPVIITAHATNAGIYTKYINWTGTLHNCHGIVVLIGTSLTPDSATWVATDIDLRDEAPHCRAVITSPDGQVATVIIPRGSQDD